MKTSKFKYNVECYKDVDKTLYVGEVECVTLAEARLVAARYPYACITCIGEIKYENGLEVLEFKKRMKNT